MPDLFDITHGAGGLWEVHRWNGVISLNVQDALDGGGHRIREAIEVTTINGLHALPERQDTGTRRVARIGDNHRPSTPGGKTVTYAGEIVASTIPKLRVLRSALIAGFAYNNAFGYMEILPHASAGGPTALFWAQVLQLDPPEEILSEDPRRTFLLGLRLPDPRIYFPGLAVDVSGNPAAVTNPGTAPADPIITVAGVSTGDDITVTDGTHTLSFRNVPAGSLVIDFAARTAKVGTVDAELVVSGSTWWDRFVNGIEPGSHSIAQTGGTGVRVQFTPADWA